MFQKIRLLAIPRCSIIPIFFVLFGLLSNGRAETFGEFIYTTNDTSATITGYTGPGGNVTIPDTIGDKPVTSIGTWAFINCTNMTGIAIPNSVTALSAYVFRGCSGLTNVVIPNSVTSFEAGTFGGCSSLTNVTLPDNVTNITDDMFIGCGKLANITLPDSVRSIGSTAFYGCNNLADIQIPGHVTSIGNWAFCLCASLTNATLPASVIQIGYSIFSGNSNLTTITVDPLNPAFSSIDGVLFNKSQTILLKYPEAKAGDYMVPATVTNVDNSSFKSCLHLTSVILPESVTIIGPSAFSGCINLACVNIPDNVTQINNQAFQGCSSLTNITIPASVTSIGWYYGVDAFVRCTSLLAIDVDPANTVYSSIDGVLFNKSQNTLYQYPGGKTGGCLIPKTVTAIQESAFSGCSGLTEFLVDPLNTAFSSLDGVLFRNGVSMFNVFDGGNKTLIACPAAKTGSYVIPNNVLKLGGFAFADCAGLTNISIPQKITIISSNAFLNCTGLTSIILPNKANGILDSAFYGCTGLTNITIPASVVRIESYAFMNCSNLTGVYFEGNAPEAKFPSEWSLNNANRATVYYCAGTTGWDSYYEYWPTALWDKTEAPDLSYQQIGAAYTIIGYLGTGGNVNIPATINGLPVTSIADYAFTYSFGTSTTTNITSVSLPNTITSIGNYAFSRCVALTNITIPDSVKNIGYHAFYGCTALTDIIILPGLTTIGSEMFLGCTALKNIMIPDSVTTIGDAAFQNCISLTSITLPNSVLNIGSSAFSDCASLTNIALPETAASMGAQCFSNCVALGNVVIPNGITNIEGGTFYHCGNLTSVVIPDSILNIGSNAFFNCGSLSGVAIPASVTNIASRAFGYCSNIKRVEFEGNAPAFVAADAFTSCNYATVYYHLGTTGWGSYLGGRPTAMVEYGFEVFGSIVTISQYKDTSSVVVIPDAIQDKRVGVIGANAFKNNGLLTTISMPDCVFKIDSSAFSGCTNLTNVLFGSGLSNIMASAFARCSNLKNIVIPAGVISIGPSTFANCTNLTSVYFEGNAPIPVPLFLFQNATNVTVYYRAGTTGWESTYAGQPTALWIEQPTYQEWAQSVGLLEKFTNASAETDDADQDGMSNLAEMQAGTDPTTANSTLKFEKAARLADLVDEDKTAIGTEQHALYFQTVPGRKYEIQRVAVIGGAWQTETNVTATTTQKRVLLTKPVDQGFYRVVLVP
jgi:hypothetical protein